MLLIVIDQGPDCCVPPMPVCGVGYGVTVGVELGDMAAWVSWSLEIAVSPAATAALWVAVAVRSLGESSAGWLPHAASARARMKRKSTRFMVRVLSVCG